MCVCGWQRRQELHAHKECPITCCRNTLFDVLTCSLRVGWMAITVGRSSISSKVYRNTMRSNSTKAKFVQVIMFVCTRYRKYNIFTQAYVKFVIYVRLFDMQIKISSLVISSFLCLDLVLFTNLSTYKYSSYCIRSI